MEKIIEPSVDYFEHYVKNGKLIDVNERFNLSLEDLDAFSISIDNCINTYVNNLDLTVLMEQKKRNMKNLEELYNPGLKNKPIHFGIINDNIPIIEQSENELIKQRQSIQRMYKRSVILKPLSFGYIVSNTPLYEV